MPRLPLALAVCLSIVPRLLLAAEGTVVGTVSSEAGPIAGATVSAVGATESVVTGADGKFRLEHLPAGETILLVVSASGFESMEQPVLVTPSRPAVVDFRLALWRWSEKVDVSGEIPLLTTGSGLGVVRLAPAQIAALPSLGERDIFRTMQLLPGVSGSNETSSGLYVRGGTPDQTLVTYDGFTVYHVDHLFGYYSAFNMDAVEDVELRKGAYEARYGGRLSSVLELARPSGPTDRWSGTGSDREHAERRRLGLDADRRPRARSCWPGGVRSRARSTTTSSTCSARTATARRAAAASGAVRDRWVARAAASAPTRRRGRTSTT